MHEEILNEISEKQVPFMEFVLQQYVENRRLVTIDGQEQYTDWEVFELSGSFTGTWQLRYWSPEGNSGEKRNCLQLTATYDDAGRDYMAYSCALTFAYADATTLRIQGYFFNDDNGWADYKREK